MSFYEFLIWVLSGFWRTLGLLFLVAAAATWRPVSVRMVGRKDGDGE